MRELRAVALSEDGGYLVLADAAGRPDADQFRVPVDDRLRAALRGARRSEVRAESALTPREIQARLRAGETAAEVARAAGIPVERVERYEGPVLAERARVVQEARAALLPKDPGGVPGRPLGEVVDARLLSAQDDPETAQWDAWRRVDGIWLVQLTSESRCARWTWDPVVRRVRPHDDAARALVAPESAETSPHPPPPPAHPPVIRPAGPALTLVHDQVPSVPSPAGEGGYGPPGPPARPAAAPAAPYPPPAATASAYGSPPAGIPTSPAVPTPAPVPATATTPRPAGTEPGLDDHNRGVGRAHPSRRGLGLESDHASPRDPAAEPHPPVLPEHGDISRYGYGDGSYPDSEISYPERAGAAPVGPAATAPRRMMPAAPARPPQARPTAPQGAGLGVARPGAPPRRLPPSASSRFGQPRERGSIPGGQQPMHPDESSHGADARLGSASRRPSGIPPRVRTAGQPAPSSPPAAPPAPVTEPPDDRQPQTPTGPDGVARSAVPPTEPDPARLPEPSDRSMLMPADPTPADPTPVREEQPSAVPTSPSAPADVPVRRPTTLPIPDDTSSSDAVTTETSARDAGTITDGTDGTDGETGEVPVGEKASQKAPARAAGKKPAAPRDGQKAPARKNAGKTEQTESVTEKAGADTSGEETAAQAAESTTPANRGRQSGAGRGGERPAGGRRGRKSVPAWDDIVFGARRT